MDGLGNAALAGLLLWPQLLCGWGFPSSHSQGATNRAWGGGGPWRCPMVLATLAAGGFHGV